MPTIMIAVDSRKLANPDADLRYFLPDVLAALSKDLLRDDGYDYSEDTFTLINYLETEDEAAGVSFVLKAIQEQRFLENNLSEAAIVAIERGGKPLIVWPKDFAGEFPRVPSPLATSWSATYLEERESLKRIQLTNDEGPLSFARALELWRTSEAFRSYFIDLLCECPFAAFRWETPGVRKSSVQQPFEFVLHNAPQLPEAADMKPFAEQFPLAKDGVAVFTNLGKDATLIVPAPEDRAHPYAHLAKFVRNAPEDQVHALWRTVGETMQRQLGDRPTWLSTAGMGVAWLDVRMDCRPKYYGFAPYTRAS